MKNPSQAVKAQISLGLRVGRYNGIFNSMHDIKLTSFFALESKSVFMSSGLFFSSVKEEKRHSRGFLPFTRSAIRKENEKKKL
jgi:hypothetical protein